MRLLIWDLDGTLAYREGGNWSAAVVEIAHDLWPDRGLTVEQIRPCLSNCYLWEVYQEPQPQLSSAEGWWAEQSALLADGLRRLGFEADEAELVAGRVRSVYADTRRFHLFPDTLAALDTLSRRGWTHAVLSNHVPELRQIMAELGLLPAVDQLFNSAETGYCKPHAGAFQQVLAAYPHASEIWMLGDNPQADVAGARAVGLPAILVRRETPGLTPYCPSLESVVAFLS